MKGLHMHTLDTARPEQLACEDILELFQDPQSDVTFTATTNGGTHYLVNLRPGKFMRINVRGEMFVHRRADVLINGVLQAPGRTTVSYGSVTRTLVVRDTGTNTVLRSSSTIRQAHQVR